MDEIKFIDSIVLESGWEIESESGWSPLTHVHKTVEFVKHHIETENSSWIDCADRHIVMDASFNEVFTEDIKLGDEIYTRFGPSKVTKNEVVGFENMYAVTTASKNQTYYSNDILSHNTTAIVGFLLHYAIFHKKRTIGIAAQNVAGAREIIHRFKLAYENIPLWLQPGVVEWQKGGVALGNGTRIFASSSNGDALRGKSLSVLILDEFAHIRNDQEFMTATWPVVSSGKETKIIVISTPNGTSNAFHQIWKESEENINGFVNFPVEWNEVPGRDDAWREKMIKQYGKRKFAQEYAASFIGSSNTLVDAHIIDALEKKVIEPIEVDTSHNVSIYEKPVAGRSYVICADVGRGYGNDYSTFSIFDVSSKPYNQVAAFSDNMISTKVFPYLLKKYGTLYNEAFIVVERNDAGGEVANILYYDIEYPEMFSERDGAVFKPGLWTSKTVKRLGCSNLRDLIESNNLSIVHPETINELKSFEGDKSGVYNAAKGFHDDLVQNCWQFAYVIENKKMAYFDDTVQGVSTLAHKSVIDKLVEDLPPIGSIGGKRLSGNQADNLRNRLLGKSPRSGFDLQLG